MANDKIKAHFRMEERYGGLQLVYGLEDQEGEKILTAIDDVKKETALDPSVFENNDPNYPEKKAYYIEFNDDFDRQAGKFFEKVLSKLDVEGCN